MSAQIKTMTSLVSATSNLKETFALAYMNKLEELRLKIIEKAGCQTYIRSACKINDTCMQISGMDENYWEIIVDSLQEVFPDFGLLITPNCKVSQ